MFCGDPGSEKFSYTLVLFKLLQQLVASNGFTPVMFTDLLDKQVLKLLSDMFDFAVRSSIALLDFDLIFVSSVSLLDLDEISEVSLEFLLRSRVKFLSCQGTDTSSIKYVSLSIVGYSLLKTKLLVSHQSRIRSDFLTVVFGSSVMCSYSATIWSVVTRILSEML